MVANWLQEVINGQSNGWLEITWVEITAEVILLKLSISSVNFNATVIWFASYSEFPSSW